MGRQAYTAASLHGERRRGLESGATPKVKSADLTANLNNAGF